MAKITLSVEVVSEDGGTWVTGTTLPVHIPSVLCPMCRDSGLRSNINLPDTVHKKINRFVPYWDSNGTFRDKKSDTTEYYLSLKCSNEHHWKHEVEVEYV